MVSEAKGNFHIDWLPSFVHQFSFVMFNWLVLDISYPTNPTQVGHFDTDIYAWSVTLSNDEIKA